MVLHKIYLYKATHGEKLSLGIEEIFNDEEHLMIYSRNLTISRKEMKMRIVKHSLILCKFDNVS